MLGGAASPGVMLKVPENKRDMQKPLSYKENFFMSERNYFQRIYDLPQPRVLSLNLTGELFNRYLASGRRVQAASVVHNNIVGQHGVLCEVKWRRSVALFR